MSEMFSIEVPELLQRHLDHLLGSEISIDVIKERGYRSILSSKQLEDLGFSRKQRRAPGILMPMHSTDGNIADCHLNVCAKHITEWSCCFWMTHYCRTFMILSPAN